MKILSKFWKTPTTEFSLKRRRRNLGLPDPELIVFWLVEKFGADNLKELPAKKSELKNPEIPLLNDYSGGADEIFGAKSFLKESYQQELQLELPSLFCSKKC